MWQHDYTPLTVKQYKYCDIIEWFLLKFGWILLKNVNFECWQSKCSWRITECSASVLVLLAGFLNSVSKCGVRKLISVKCAFGPSKIIGIRIRKATAVLSDWPAYPALWQPHTKVTNRNSFTLPPKPNLSYSNGSTLSCRENLDKSQLNVKQPGPVGQ